MERNRPHYQSLKPHNMTKKETINVQGTEIILLSHQKEDYISLTDMAKFKNAEIPATVISHWMSTNFSINYMGLWERMNNPDFNLTGFREVKMLSTETGFALSPKQWIAMTNAVGIVSKAGRYGGGTFAHRNIAFEFASWLSPEFKYYLISEFERLKIDEQHTKSLEWNLQRTLSKINYRIHTDAIKEHIIPHVVTKEQISYTYINALLIQQQLTQGERLVQLNNVAITQMRSLVENRNLKQLK
jgi:hypothetical protein